MKKDKTKCEFVPCENDATELEPCEGILWEVCKGHKKILKKQKELDNNI